MDQLKKLLAITKAKKFNAILLMQSVVEKRELTETQMSEDEIKNSIASESLFLGKKEAFNEIIDMLKFITGEN